MKKVLALNLVILLLVIVSGGCAKQPVVLEEVKTEKVPEVKKLPPLRGMVTEIELVKGEQKFIYMKMGAPSEWYKVGLIGYVYNDVAMTEKIAKFEVVEVYENFSKGKILELNYTIIPKAVVEVEVDPRFLSK